MRWNRRERRAGWAVFAATLLVAYGTAESPETAAARVQPGMTPAEVESALGTRARPSDDQPVLIVLPNFAGIKSEEERDRFLNETWEYKRRNRPSANDYHLL